MAGPFPGGGGGSTGGGSTSGSGSVTGGNTGRGLGSLQPNTKKLPPRVEALEQRLDDLSLPPDLSAPVKRLQMEVAALKKASSVEDDDSAIFAVIEAEKNSRIAEDTTLQDEIDNFSGSAVGDIDGGLPDSIYGGTTPVDGGSP